MKCLKENLLWLGIYGILVIKRKKKITLQNMSSLIKYNLIKADDEKNKNGIKSF